jgi:hypothetical protein
MKQKMCGTLLHGKNLNEQAADLLLAVLVGGAGDGYK